MRVLISCALHCSDSYFIYQIKTGETETQLQNLSHEKQNIELLNNVFNAATGWTFIFISF